MTMMRSLTASSLALVVRDVGDGEAEALLQGTDLLAHRAAQTRVEVRERLVEEQHGRLEDEDEGAGECDALLLTTGEFPGAVMRSLFQSHLAQPLGSFFLHVLPGTASQK